MLKIPRKHLKVVKSKVSKRGSSTTYKYNYKIKKKDGSRVHKKGTHKRVVKR